MFNWLRPRQKETPPSAPKDRLSFFSTHAFDIERPLLTASDCVANLVNGLPKVTAEGAQDAADSAQALKANTQGGTISEALAMWYLSQGFIGHQFCAILSQHWLINKACSAPGRDAVRNGFDIVTVDGDDLPPEAAKILKKFDRAYKLRWNLEQFVRMGRVFGIRVALFKVDSTDKEYYEKPFNIDGVTPNSYKGIVQVDPYWCAPELDQNASGSPDSMHFYEPTYWRINGQRYHRSHLVIFRPNEVPDLLKPQYLYGGVSVPQQIMERVYAAERVSNEAPQLAQTKRTNVWRTDMTAFLAKGDAAVEALNRWIYYRDNYGIKLGDKDGDEFQQFDTNLADLDAVIMTQYQIVAATANVPVTKLMGTTPKGFNSTGEYEEASYHEELESLQTHDLTPLVERHHALVMRSAVVPLLKIDPVETTVEWKPLDSPTAKELADTNLAKAQTGAALVNSGAITSEEERQRVVMDPSGGYHNLGLDAALPAHEDDDPDDDGPEAD